jgi:hypothetical protein
LAACAAAMAGLVTPLLADDGAEKAEATKRYPYVSGDISAEFYLDTVFDADNPDAKGQDAYNTTEIKAEAHFSEWVSIFTGLVLEPVKDRQPGDDRYFEDHGLYVEQLYGKLSFNSVQVLAGKFNPAFGRAWDDAPGIYGTDMAVDYELTERVGAGFSVRKDSTAFGTAKLQASAFHADKSFLADSAFTSRADAYRVDGGLSDTGNLDSFAISLEGKKLPDFPGISYNLGYAHQAGSGADLDDQNGFVFGLQAERKYNGAEFKLIVEAAYFDYAGDLYDSGDPDLFVEAAWYLTLGLETKIDKYHAAAAYTMRDAELFNESDFDDYQYQVSAGIDFAPGWSLDIGYKFLRAQGEESYTLGLMLIKVIEFDTSAARPLSQ